MCQTHICLMLAPLAFARATATGVRPMAWPCAAAAAVIVLAAAASAPLTHGLWLLLAAPLLEEIVFRGGLQEALLRRTDCALLANFVTAFTFAASHVAVRADALAALTLLPALAIGHFYQRQRRLAPCIATHALFNAVWLLST